MKNQTPNMAEPRTIKGPGCLATLVISFMLSMIALLIGYNIGLRGTNAVIAAVVGIGAGIVVSIIIVYLFMQDR